MVVCPKFPKAGGAARGVVFDANNPAFNVGAVVAGWPKEKPVAVVVGAPKPNDGPVVVVIDALPKLNDAISRWCNACFSAMESRYSPGFTASAPRGPSGARKGSSTIKIVDAMRNSDSGSPAFYEVRNDGNLLKPSWRNT